MGPGRDAPANSLHFLPLADAPAARARVADLVLPNTRGAAVATATATGAALEDALAEDSRALFAAMARVADLVLPIAGGAASASVVDGAALEDALAVDTPAAPVAAGWRA